MSTDYKPAHWHPHSHYWTGRASHKPRWIIMHGSYTPGITEAEPLAVEYQNSNNDFGPHFIVGRDGVVIQCVALANAAHAEMNPETGADWWWGKAGNPHLDTISIVVVKNDSENKIGLTDIQQRALFDLLDFLCRKWSIRPHWANEEGGITGHYSIAPTTHRFDPGPMPWDDLFSYLVRPVDLQRISRSRLGTQTALHNPILVERESQQYQQAKKPAPHLMPEVKSNIITDLPGFAPLVSGLDHTSKFQKLQDGANLGDLGIFTAHNTMSALMRVVLIVIGVALFIGLLLSAGRRNAWMADAGADLPALLYKVGR